MKNFNPHRSNAFTLIEILIVVGIVGILVAILIPTVSSAKENARAVICRSNLSQWALVMSAYVEEHAGFLPYESRGDESLGRICWYDAMNWSGKSGGQKGFEKVKVCPTVALTNPNCEESYRMNSKLADTKSDSQYYMPYRRLGSLTRPGQTVVLFDGDVGGTTVSLKGRWKLKNSEVNCRHNGFANLLFADWHVAYYTSKALTEKSVNNTPIVWQPEDMGPWVPNPDI